MKKFAITVDIFSRLTSHKPLVNFLAPNAVASLIIASLCLIKYAFVFVRMVINLLSQNWPRDNKDCCLSAGNTVARNADGGNQWNMVEVYSCCMGRVDTGPIWDAHTNAICSWRSIIAWCFTA